jgi:endonuclease YncB( thermonuclease family)
MLPEFIYRCTIDRVIDADTLAVTVDLGFCIHTKTQVRLYGVNAPELTTPEGKAAKKWAKEWVDRQDAFTLQTFKDKREKYGRMLARVYGTSGHILNDDLITAGQALPMESTR